jgi:hypothetical protein
MVVLERSAEPQDGVAGSREQNEKNLGIEIASGATNTKSFSVLADAATTTTSYSTTTSSFFYFKKKNFK